MRRIPRRRFAILASSLAVVLTVCVLNRDPAGTEGHALTQEPDHAEKLRPRVSAPELARRSSPQGAATTRGFGSRAEQLKDLKKRWLGIGEKTAGEHSAEELDHRKELSKECARRLLCSAEAVELLVFLEKEGISNSVETAIQRLFETELAKEARQTLLSLPDERTAEGTNYRELWSGSAGKSCPPEDFADFCAALGSPVCVQEAVFGHNVTLTQTDPLGALASTIGQIEKNQNSRTKNSSLKRLVEALPPGADFAQVEQLLPAAEPDDPLSPYRGIKNSLVRSWSKHDPTAVVNYLMENPDRFQIAFINYPVTQVLDADLFSGIEWIQTFPDGSFFDTAAGLAVTRLHERGYSKEAHILSAQIGNPQTRNETMDAVLKPYRNPRD